MLGSRIEISLISILVLSVSIIPVFAEDELVSLETDKEQYEIGDTLNISGTVSEKKMPVVALRLYDPDDNILSANQIEIEDNNTFSKIVFLDPPFYEKTGTYTITLEYGKLKAETSFNIGEDEIISELEEEILEEITPEVLVITDKSQYQDGDTVVISGFVTAVVDPTVLIGIYDPFGSPGGFYFGAINADQEFSVSFLVKEGVNFKAEGVYSVVARYGASEDVMPFYFIKQENIDTSNQADDTTVNDNTKSTETSTPKPKPVAKVEKKPTQKVAEPPKTNQNNNAKITEPREYDNLSVEDLELGIILNNIQLNCDKNEFTDEVSYYDGMGPALVRLCKYEQAISFYDQSLVDEPDNIEFLTNKGSALNKLGHYKEAIIYYDSALEKEPQYIPALNNKANALANQGFYKDAISIYAQALEIDPDYKIALHNMETAVSKVDFGDSSPPRKTIPPEPEPLLQKAEFNVKSSNGKTINENEDSDFFKQISAVFSSLGNVLFGFN